MGRLSNCIPSRSGKRLSRRLLKQPTSNQTVQKFLDVTSYYGQVVEMDNQGRLTIAEWLRNKFGLKGEVAVIGKLNHIEIRVKEEFDAACEEQSADAGGYGRTVAVEEFSWWTPIRSPKAVKAL